MPDCEAPCYWLSVCIYDSDLNESMYLAWKVWEGLVELWAAATSTIKAPARQGC